MTDITVKFTLLLFYSDTAAHLSMSSDVPMIDSTIRNQFIGLKNIGIGFSLAIGFVIVKLI